MVYAILFTDIIGNDNGNVGYSGNKYFTYCCLYLNIVIFFMFQLNILFHYPIPISSPERSLYNPPGSGLYLFPPFFQHRFSNTLAKKRKERKKKVAQLLALVPHPPSKPSRVTLILDLVLQTVFLWPRFS